MQKKRLKYNTISSLSYQVVAIVCGFILPKAILSAYGSEVNGLVSSISQFLSIITFLDFGVGSVVRSSYYKPLAEKDYYKISCVYKSATIYFNRIAKIMLGYIIVLIITYPAFINSRFDFAYTATLIAAMSISNLANYFIGITKSQLLSADQHGYIQYIAQTVTVLLNTIVCVLLIKSGVSIQFVKLTTSIIFTLRPLYVCWYVNKHYNLDKNVSYQEEPINQKWNGLAQHLASVILNSTDTIVLTVFSSLSNVSIYSVYYLVVHGVNQIVTSLTNGIQSLLGELWAKKELKELENTFGWIEWIIHTGAVFFYGCTIVLVLPFVSIYTKGISDVNYHQPLFAVLIVLANAGHSLRLPYNMMILAAGHFKQTQHNYIVAMLLNIAISIATVKLWGLIGVAIGTITAMLYQTVWMAWYNSKNINKWPFKRFAKQIFADMLIMIIASLICSIIKFSPESYISWAICAVIVALIWIATIAAVNMILYKDKITVLFKKFCRIIKL